MNTDPRRTIDIVPTMANLFGCDDNPDVIDQLCDLSDLADNVRISLVNSDLRSACDDMSITIPHFLLAFAVWKDV